MKLKRIETPGISHYAYLIADGNEAALIDPRRDVEEYLLAARDMGVQIKYVIETHRQEDFVMGSAYLAKQTGARIVNGDHKLFGHGDVRLKDGDTFRIGELKIRALHTPGHTMESMSYAVYASGNNDQAWCVFTGDTLFFGTTGRTDLPDKEKSAENAALLYDSVHSKLAGLGDTALVLPAHGPGSVCGSGMAERPYSTIGDEKRYNDVFTLSRSAFAKKKGSERLSRPPFFRHMEKVNLLGGLDPVIRPGVVKLLDINTFANTCNDAFVFDAREPEGFAGGHIGNSFSIWTGGMPVFGGWIGDERSPIYLVTDREEDIDVVATHLTRIGIDNIEGALAGGFASWRSSGENIEFSGVITPQDLAKDRNHLQILDVREIDEFDSGHIPHASHMFVGYLQERVDELDLHKDQPVVVTCSVGHRASLAVSILLRAGYKDVRNLLGGMTAWKKCQLPME